MVAVVGALSSLLRATAALVFDSAWDAGSHVQVIRWKVWGVRRWRMWGVRRWRVWGVMQGVYCWH